MKYVETSIVPIFDIINPKYPSFPLKYIFNYNDIPSNNNSLQNNKNILIIENYMKSFLSETKDIHLLQTVIKKLKSNIKYTSNTNVFDKLPLELISYITLFLTIEDYAFSILQVSKYFYNNLNPFKSSFIMRNLIKNECLKCLKPSQISLKYNSYESELNKWEICGCYAWINKNNNVECTQPKSRNVNICKNVKDSCIHYKFIKNKSLRSTLFLLNFVYKCRYGDISSIIHLRKLLLLLLSTNGGTLIIRYMIYFYYKEFVLRKKRESINTNTFITTQGRGRNLKRRKLEYHYIRSHIPSLFGEAKNIETHTVKRRINDLLFEAYDDETFFTKVIKNNDGYGYQIEINHDLNSMQDTKDIEFYHLSSIIV